MDHAGGTFEVTMKPEELTEVAAASGLGRMSLRKVFQGQLEATSVGEFLSVMGSEKGSAGYVAMERVTGTLNGIAGSFALQHTGTMNRGEPSLTISVVPDSGTDELVGLQGTMTIDVVDRVHHYSFRYSLDS
jgi:hypothetical protein